MKMLDVKSVDQYIASQPPDTRPLLERVRSSIRKAIPAAEEQISYKIPAYKLHGRVVIYFAGWKQHFSLYPATRSLVSALEDELAGYEVQKGTIRFPLTGRVPAGLIGRIAKLRAREVAAEHKARGAKRKKR
jgi:uncharacterized protein YdhG (YjbR/CyaY superfamily)